MDAVQSTAVSPAVHRAVGDAKSAQLIEADHSVLSSSQSRERPIQRGLDVKPRYIVGFASHLC